MSRRTESFVTMLVLLIVVIIGASFAAVATGQATGGGKLHGDAPARVEGVQLLPSPVQQGITGRALPPEGVTIVEWALTPELLRAPLVQR